MSTDAKEQRKREAMQLAGQDSDDARAAVKRQRELKKKRDAQRKAEKKLKALSPEHADYAAAQHELDTVLREIAALEGVAAAAASASAAADTGTTTVAVPSSVRGDTSTDKAMRVDTSSGSNSHKNNNNNEHSDNNVDREGNVKATASDSGGAHAASADDDEDATAVRQRLLSLVEQARRASRVERVAVSARASVVHPRVAEVAVLMAEMRIVGGNARTLALLHAFRELLAHTTVLAASTLRDVDTTAFEQLIEANFAFVRSRREATSGMRYVKRVLVRRFVALRDAAAAAAAAAQRSDDDRTAAATSTPPAAAAATTRDGNATSSPPCDAATATTTATTTTTTDDDLGSDARDAALRLLATIELELKVSLKSIVEERSLPYVSSSDSILVFGRSSAVEAVLLARARSAAHRPRHVYVVDSAPLYEGRALAQRLCDAGVDVTYSLITACCTLMPRCTRVLLGAASVLQNGDVFSRCGTALVAACAKSFRKPVLCFCESYKFVPAVWLGNLAQNTKLRDVQAAVAQLQRANLASAMTATTAAAAAAPLSSSSSSLWCTASAAAAAGAAAGGERSPLRQQLSPLPPPTPSPTNYAQGTWAAWGNKYDGTSSSSVFVPTMTTTALTVADVSGSGGGGATSATAAAATTPAHSLSTSASGYLYDLTPAAYVDMIICEMGCLHTSAIVAAIRDREGRDAAPHLYMEKHT